MKNFEERLSDFSKVRLGVLCDDVGEDRSVLVAPAQEITDITVNTILASSGGLTFVAITPERAAALLLSPMNRGNFSVSGASSQLAMSQYISVEAREGVSTGISAADRATTIRLIGAPAPQPRSLVRPGHVFPVQTKKGGTLVRSSLPEAAVDVVVRAGFTDAALFVDLLDPSGEIMDATEVMHWVASQNLPRFTISEIVRERLVREPLVTRLAEATIPTQCAGEFTMIAYRSQIHEMEHVALIKGTLDTREPVLVRVQVEHTLSDVFGGTSPATREQIRNALIAIQQRGHGVLIYLRNSQLRAESTLNQFISLQRLAEPLPAAAMREYGVGAQILCDLGIKRLDLLSTTQRSLVGLESFGMVVSKHSPIPCFSSSR